MNEREVKTKNVLKRILSLFIINVMLISLFAPYSTVFAAVDPETADIKLQLLTSATTVTAGSQITINVQFKEVSNPITELDLGLNYDKSVLEVAYNDEDGVYEVYSKQGWSLTYGYEKEGAAVDNADRIYMSTRWNSI